MTEKYMRALTIRQPWAWAILRAGKDVENRDWPTNYRGPIAIHAAKGCTSDEYFSAFNFIRRIVGHQRLYELGWPGYNTDALVRGAIIGTAEIVGCVDNHPSPWFEGDYGFVIANVKALPEPIPCKGALMFWEVPAELAMRVSDAVSL
jgi:hypothetical protein